MELDNQGLVTVLDKNVRKKEHLFQQSLPKYMTRSVFAGMYLTLGTAIAVMVGQQGNAINPALGKFFYAITFSLALLMIIYMNSELVTSNMMYLTVGVHRKVFPIHRALSILFVCALFNIIGGTLFSFVISQTNMFKNLVDDHYLYTTVAGKLTKTSWEIIYEGILANVIVNTAILVTLRMKDDAGKLIAIVLIIHVFAFLGFEHVAANFSSFSMAFFANGGATTGMTISSVLHNYFFAFIGNYIGGGLVIGFIYSWLNQGETQYTD